MNIFLNSNSTYHVYSNLGEYIKKSFFHLGNIGREVFPIIDKPFIQRFCQKYSITNNEFIEQIQKISLWEINWEQSIYELLGLVGIQLYAASQMETSGGVTSGNFRERICSEAILKMNLSVWDSWAKENQDCLWKKYYNWCDNKGFIIVNKCKPMHGKDRYVQYPKEHSSLTLNQEDLKTISYLFIEKKLTPNEDLTENEFWKIIGKIHFASYYSNRSKRILEKNRDLANKQIYQYFLFWEGEYTNPYKNLLNSKLERFQLYLYYIEGKWSVDVYNVGTNKIEINIPLNCPTFIQKLKRYYCIKHSEGIIFKQNDNYDNYWEETRYIDNHKEIGYALMKHNTLFLQYYQKDIVAKFNNYVLLRIDYIHYPHFFSEERPYQLTDGLKIMPNTYLLGAPPLLNFKHKIPFWIDGILQQEVKGKVVLQLDEGEHILSIKGFKPIIINISKVNPNILSWNNELKWDIDRKKNSSSWSSLKKEGNIIGLDYEEAILSQEFPKKEPMLTRWSRNILFNKETKNLIDIFLTKK